MRAFAAAFLANLWLLGQAPATPARPVAALSPFVDVHAHLEIDSLTASADAARQALNVENAARMIFLPPPFTSDDPSRYDAEQIASAIGSSRATFAFLRRRARSTRRHAFPRPHGGARTPRAPPSSGLTPGQTAPGTARPLWAASFYGLTRTSTCRSSLIPPIQGKIIRSMP